MSLEALLAALSRPIGALVKIARRKPLGSPLGAPLSNAHNAKYESIGSSQRRELDLETDLTRVA